MPALVDRIASKLAFFPPDPSYEVLMHKDGTDELYIQPNDPSYPRVQCQVQMIPTKPVPGFGGGNTEVVTAFIQHRLPGGKPAPLTLLYSHGNAVDLGQMLPLYKDLSSLLGVNVCGYDYSGYGCSTGANPSVAASLADVSAVYRLLRDTHGVDARSIILYGQSVGSGPTCYLAAREPGVGGVVLHSPLLSGVRVLWPRLKAWPRWLDVFPNLDWVKQARCPLTVMHGTADEVIAVSHGRELARLAKDPFTHLFAEGFTHQNLETAAEYVPHLQSFVAHVSDRLAEEPLAD